MEPSKLPPTLSPELIALAQELARQIVAATSALDPRDQVTVAEVINSHVKHCREEVCDEVHAHRVQVLGEFSALYGAKRMAECNPLQLKEFLERPSWKAGRTKAKARCRVLRAFNWAKGCRLIKVNPFEGCPKPAEGPGGRPMLDDTYRVILRNVKPHVRRLLTFLRYTGCRPIEACQLEWSMIDWERKIAVLKEHKTAKKTGKPRVLYLHPVVVKLLRWIDRRRTADHIDHWLAGVLKKGPVKAHVLTRLARQKGYSLRRLYQARQRIGATKKRVLVPNTDSTRHKTRLRYVYSLTGKPRLPRIDGLSTRVFLTLRQTVWNRRSLGKVLYRLYQLGLVDRGAFHAYGLRHRAATEAIKAGVNLKVVSVMMGHTQISTTMAYIETIDEDTDLIQAELLKVQQGPKGAPPCNPT